MYQNLWKLRLLDGDSLSSGGDWSVLASRRIEYIIIHRRRVRRDTRPKHKNIPFILHTLCILFFVHTRARSDMINKLIIIVNLVDNKLLLFNVERWIPIPETARAVQKKKIFSITSYIHTV